jgi:hypothetical protein
MRYIGGMETQEDDVKYRITSLADLAAAFRGMAKHERQQWHGAAKTRQREVEVRARAYEACATLVEQTELVGSEPAAAKEKVA